MMKLLYLALLFSLVGCSTIRPTKETTSAEGPPRSVLNEGYTLLDQLMSDEKDVSKLLIVKREPAAVVETIKSIAARAGEAHKQLEAFAKADARLNLKLKTLPLIEQETRDSIGKARTKELLFQNSKKIELPLLLTQNEAL